MSIELSCTSCAKKLKVKDEAAGRLVKCPGCGTMLRVAAAPAPEPEPAVDLMPDEPAPEPQAAAPKARTRTTSALPGRRPVRELRGAGGRPEGLALGMGLAGGVAAAVIGAFVWYLIAKGANAKIGWIAWGIGWATGFAVAALSGGKDGVVYCAMGAGCALFGWLLGEFMIYSWVFQDMLAAELQKMAGKAADPETQAEIKAALAEISFGQYLKGTFGLMDVLFIGLAVVTGWGIPQKMASR